MTIESIRSMLGITPGMMNRGRASLSQSSPATVKRQPDENAQFRAEYREHAARLKAAGISIDDYIAGRRVDLGLDQLQPATLRDEIAANGVIKFPLLEAQNELP